jgi:methionyl-tRNA synthetase
MRLRTGKALVPFRITGNIDWGVPAPPLEDTSDLTVWCWPESLWAPISFSRAYLEHKGQGIETLNPTRAAAFAAACANGDEAALTWQDFWCSPDAAVFQFIGQDNIYFYGDAQPALWAAQQTGHAPTAQAAPGELQQTTLIANYHLLFLDKKASSSGSIKPPMADELLDHYTPEQLRAHFIALGLGLKPVSFQPKPFDPNANPKAADPALKEGSLLTNVFNRLARSCFYEAQRSNGGCLPLGAIEPRFIEEARKTILAYERCMHRFELHAVSQLVDEYVRTANKYWADAIKSAGDDADARKTVLCCAFYQLRVATVLLHPIAPLGTQKVVEYLALGAFEQEFFSWEHIFEGYEPFVTDAEKSRGGHPLKELPPRSDFFAKHPSQFE